MVGPLLEAGVDKRVIDVMEPREPGKTVMSHSIIIYKDFCVLYPEPLVHDVPNCGWHVCQDGEWMFYATDTATLDGVEAQGYDLYLIEANHTREELEARARAKLEAGEFAYEYRAAANHLSQEQALDWLAKNMGLNSQYVFLHQHQEKNTLP